MSEAYLEDDETVDAEIFVSKASLHMNEVGDWALQLRYRVAYARILDANRKFVEASTRYYELSNTTNTDVSLSSSSTIEFIFVVDLLSSLNFV